MKRRFVLTTLAAGSLGAGALAGPYVGAAGTAGSTALAGNDARFVAWGSTVAELRRGPRDISNPGGLAASFGTAASALGPANSFDSQTGEPSIQPGSVVSLGDGGWITLGFANPITNGAGFDFAVFENGFNDTFLELAFVEVSSDGATFVRFPCASLTPTTSQIDQLDDASDSIDPTNIDGFAGKYRAGWGTPFELALLAGKPGLDITAIRFVRVRDVIGSVERDPDTGAPLYPSFDSAIRGARRSRAAGSISTRSA